jgi:hypothetical protein
VVLVMLPPSVVVVLPCSLLVREKRCAQLFMRRAAGVAGGGTGGSGGTGGGA